jgi:predicted PurR-regulated permease PerM
MPDTQPLTFRRRATVLVLLWVALAGVPLVFPAAILPFAGSALIAYLVAPVLEWLTGQRAFGRVIPRWVAILLIYAVFFLLTYLFIIAIVPQLYREVVRISSNAFAFARSLTPERVQEIARQMEDWLNSHGVPVALSSRSLEGADAAEAYTGRPSWSLSMDLERLLHDAAGRFSGVATANVTKLVAFTQALITGVFKGVFTLFLMLMVAAFISIDAAGIRAYFRSLVPPGGPPTRPRWSGGSTGVSRAGAGQVTICVVTGSSPCRAGALRGEVCLPPRDRRHLLQPHPHLRDHHQLVPHRHHGPGPELARRVRDAVLDHRHPRAGGVLPQPQDHGQRGADAPGGGGVRAHRG